MNKPEPNAGGGTALYTDRANTGITLEAIAETMEQPGFGPEHLPELWQQVTVQGGRHRRPRRDAWYDGIGKMYRRCETYSQYANLAAALSEMPSAAWHETGWAEAQADKLLQQASAEQLCHALAYEQNRPTVLWKASEDILAWATLEQLTRQVIDQYPWHDGFRLHTTTKPAAPDPYEPVQEDPRRRTAQYIVEHVQQQLQGDNNAWTVFLGIVEPGTVIGHCIELAKTIETRPDRPST